jgi:hypothetical protein
MTGVMETRAVRGADEELKFADEVGGNSPR